MIIHDVEQGTQEWYALRAGMPTASEFSKLVTSDGSLSKSLEGYAKTLAAEKLAGRPVDAWQGNKHTDRGKELEPDAVAYYNFINECEIETVGFVTSDDGTCGCSPDGLVGPDGLAEFKCLKAENHIDAILYFRKHGRCKPAYIQQTQGQILICGREWCDLVFYHPDLPSLIIRQERGTEEFSDNLFASISDVCAERDRIFDEITAFGGGVAIETSPSCDNGEEK